MGEYLLCDRGFVPTITLVVDRQTARRIRYHPNLRAAEDTDFAIRLSLEGVRFRMAEEPGAVWRDLHDPARASAHGQAEDFGDWLDQMRPGSSARARYGARGWAYAKMLARDGRKGTALALYLTALRHRCYRPRLALVVFLQIFLDAKKYRALADAGIRWLHMGLREPAPTRHRQQSQARGRVITRRGASGARRRRPDHASPGAGAHTPTGLCLFARVGRGQGHPVRQRRRHL